MDTLEALRSRLDTVDRTLLEALSMAERGDAGYPFLTIENTTAAGAVDRAHGGPA